MINKKSLAIRTLISMSGRITAIVLIVTLMGYFHLKKTIITKTKDTLVDYMAERGARERLLFDESRRTHSFLTDRFVEKYRAYAKDPNLKEKFKKVAQTDQDQIVRSRARDFIGKSQAGIYLNYPKTIEISLMAKTLAARDVSETYGPAFHHSFQDTYFTFPENGIVLYWPEFPNWVFDAKKDLNILNEEYFSVAAPENDRSRSIVWTGQFYDKVSKIWMITASSPIYIDGVFVASVHHDMITNEIIQRTLNDHLDGMSNFIVRTDGRLIVHPDHQKQIEEHDGKYDISKNSEPTLYSQFNLISKGSDQSEKTIYEDENNYLAVTPISGPNWLLVTKLPKRLVERAAFDNVGFLLGAGLFSLIIELIVFFFILRREITRPLLDLVTATEKIAGGDLEIQIAKNREDELGLLASSFNKMTLAIKHRDQILEKHNVDLEKLVKERTFELDNQKEINIQSSRLSALGEMAGGIAHEINTPLATIKLIASQTKQHIVDDIPDLDKVADGLVRIDRTVDRVAKIIRGLKAFARDGSNDEFEKIPLITIIEDTVSLCVERFRLNGVNLEVDLLNEEIFIECRAVQLCQVLLNLLNNSYDAIEHLDNKWIHVKVVESNEYVEIRIVDSGFGVPSEVAERVFDPFFTTKAIGKGTGMGLSISHGIIKGHQGRLFIDKNEAHTCFVMLVPKVISRAA
jgi:signal transduction histidine kinase